MPAAGVGCLPQLASGSFCAARVDSRAFRRACGRLWPMNEPHEFANRRRWFLAHVGGVLVWIGSLAAGVITGRLGLGILGWSALALAGFAGLRAGVSLLAPRGSSALMDADPARSGNAVDGYTASGPVSMILWLAIVLGAAGAGRIRPGWDDKVLADWNGMMIAALARAAPVFGEAGWLSAAIRAFDFVAESMTLDGRLMHCWRRGRLQHAATLDDYALMSDAALALFEATGQKQFIEQAQRWIDILDAHYWDQDAGGFFLTADDAEGLIVRTKNAHDNATPSGNGVMASVLSRLFYHTGKEFYRERAESQIQAFSGELQRNFFPLSSLLNGAELYQAAVQLVILGERDAEDTQALLNSTYNRSCPTLILNVVGAEDAIPDGHPAAGRSQSDGQATAFVCRGQTCSLPITDPAALQKALGA